MRGIGKILRIGPPSLPPSGTGGAIAGYAILGTALLSSPLLLPLALALLMAGLHGTTVGSSLLAHLHVVYISSVVYCLAALAAAAYLLRRSAPNSPESSAPLVPTRVPDTRYLEFQRWQFAHSRHTDDALHSGVNA